MRLRFGLLLWALVVPQVLAQQKPVTSTDLEPFIDGVIETSMESEHVPGVVVGVVAGGEVKLLKGYGFADVDAREPVDPATTMFRIGSVSKLFTWVALMQLEAAGKVDFDTDINEYLEGVEVPATFPQPITIKHLMTHTPGFEDHVIGLFGRDASTMRPLVDLLNEEMPTRVRPPGQYASYSNHGVALAGLIVEQVSGEPWADYIENHILSPLGMDYTTMHQPLPAELEPLMAKGYQRSAGKYVAKDFEYVPAAPAGSTSASGADMLRLLQAFMGDGSFDGGRILSPEANQEMQQALHRAIEGDSALLHGFYESNSHGQRMFGHGGDTIWFHTELIIMPDANVGWFISTNSQAGPILRARFHREFLDRYFGRPGNPALEFEKTSPSKLVGEYGSLRHAHDDIGKLALLLGAITVAVDADGELMLVGGQEPVYLKEIRPLTFELVGQPDLVSFKLGDDGTASHLFLSNVPVVAFQRVSGLDSPGLHRAVLAFCLGTFGWVLVAWSVQRFSRRFVLPESVASLRLAAWWTAFSVFALMLGLAVAVGDPNDIVFGLSGSVETVLLIPYLTLPLAVATLLLYIPVLREPGVTRFEKFGYALVVLAAVDFTWFMAYWQLI